jgi:anti-sigma factor RsiW
MRCDECRDLIDAYVDGELPAGDTELVAAHLAECADCSRDYRVAAATSRQLKEGLVRHTAPDVLKARIRSALAQPELEAPRRARVPQWSWMLAAGVAIAVASSMTTLAAVRDRDPARAVAGELLASHVRSLMPGHLTDVVSSNQHNVKPWFNGRVNLSPAVPALDSLGFNLIGGRIDYIGGRPVPVVIYGRRQHVINVFSWPESERGGQLSGTTAQGYRIVTWRTGDVRYSVVTDLNGTETQQFVDDYQRASQEPPAAAPPRP